MEAHEYALGGVTDLRDLHRKSPPLEIHSKMWQECLGAFSRMIKGHTNLHHAHHHTHALEQCMSRYSK